MRCDIAGIGTYITNGTLSRVHIGSRLKSWYQKALDAAVGYDFPQYRTKNSQHLCNQNAGIRLTLENNVIVHHSTNMW